MYSTLEVLFFLLKMIIIRGSRYNKCLNQEILVEKEIIIIAGPNGSGKTTLAHDFLVIYKYEFLNADDMAKDLSPSSYDQVRIAAGKKFLIKLKHLINQNKSIIIESTLSGNYLIPVIKEAKIKGYQVVIIFIFLENVEIALKRIAERVLKGGHSVPEKDVFRRFSRSKINFWKKYRSIVNNWHLFYNSEDTFEQVAFGNEIDYIIVNECNFDIFLKILRNTLMVVKKFNNIEIYQRAIEFKQIGDQAIRKAREENKKLGIPNACSRDGRLYYELPNGKLTYKNPFV